MFKTSFILSILIILTSIGSVFAVSNAFTDVYLLPKWFCLFIGISSMLAYCGGILTMQKECFHLDVHILCKCIVGICLIQALLGIVQYFGFFRTLTNFPVAGSFDNPAGFVSCICAGIPLGYLFFKWKNPYHWLGIGVVFIAILFLNSRTGLISFSLIGIILFLQQNKINMKWKFLLIIFFVLFCLGLITLYKIDSANGRMLIWKCSWEMIKENPLLGHGIGSFKANYMDYQATYFRTFSTSEYDLKERGMRLSGSKWEGSVYSDFRSVYPLFTLPATLKTNRQIVKAESDAEIRYVRWLATPSNFNVHAAEIAFYDAKSNKEIPYKMMNIPEPMNEKYKTANMQDHNVLSYYQAKENGAQILTFDLGNYYQLKEMLYTPWNDDNYVSPGEEYELFYHNGIGGWQSLGKQMATSDSLVYDNIPSNAILWLRNLTKGKEEQQFIIDQEGNQSFH